MKRDLPRTTEDRELKRADSPCEIIVSVETLKVALAAISRGECSRLFAWAAPQSHGCKPVVRGLYLVSHRLDQILAI